MVRETRHLWIGNLPENIREERIREHFKRYGRVQSVKLLPGSNGSLCAAVAFMDIKSASKAHNCEHTLDEHALSTEYYEPGPYTSSQQRFPLGITDDHSAFERTSHFYERGASTPSTPLSATGTRAEMDGYLRRSSIYHAPPDTLRGRPRDRPYRNGPPYPTGTERSACSNSRRNWVYDTGTVRYLNSTDEHATGKAKKVRSGSESRSGSHSSRSRSPTRSTTGSPHSSDSGTLSESPRSTRVTVQSTIAPPVQQTSTLAVYSEDRRPLAICVRNLPTRSSDTSLKDGLFHEYKKHGKVTWVKVVGTANERYALVCFKKPEDVEKAIEVSQDKLFFGCKIDVVPYHGYDVEDNEARPYDTELDEYHPKATRTLFIGNLEKDVTAGDLRQHFDQFGEIIEIDIKKQPGVTSSYAFCQYADIGSVVQAMRTLDGEPLGEARLKLGFGKSMASSCVWIAGVAEQVSDKYLDLQFRKFGPVSHVVVDRDRGQALIFYEQVSAAAAAVKEMRGVPLRGNRIQIDFASRECQQAFYERIDTQGRDNNWSSFESSRSERDILCSRYESTRFRYEPPRVRSSSYSRSSGGRTPRRHEVYDSPRYKSYEELSPNSDHDEYTSNETPDLRHLHKERNHLQHLLDQLDRPLRSVKAADQGLVVTTHNHRRRLSSHQRSSGEGPAPLCKRRKTGSTSEDERKKHHHHHSGDESRPGTPLFDEKPDNNQPQEPRRVPRDRPEEPLCLPLPQFAAHCFSNMKSGPTSTTSSNSVTVQQAPPASPRPPSPLSSTSSSDLSPQSPTLEERIRSLDEKYEKWTGRTLQPPTKPKHRLLDVDVHELQPSDIVKSVLAKPSVFDDDSKRLENFGEKYEPRDFSSYPRSVGLEVQRFVPGDPRNPSYLSNLSVKVSPVNSPSGILLSPCPAAKGLQYPFPSHPPVQPTTSVATTTAGSSPPPSSVTRPISKSVEFSVQKAESWLGITKSLDSSSQKDSLIYGGFPQRFSAYTKVGDTASQRQNINKSTDLTTPKIDIPAQKSTDPRIEKANSLTTTTSVLSQRIAVKSSEPLEITKNEVISQKLSATGISNNINNIISNISITKIGNSNSHFSVSNTSYNNSSINKNSNNNENKSSNNLVSICKNNNNDAKEIINTSSVIKSGKEEETTVNTSDVNLVNTIRVSSVSKTIEILEKSLDCSLTCNKSLKSDIIRNESSNEKKDSLILSDGSVSFSKESRINIKKNVESENSNIFSSDKLSVDCKNKAEGILQNCESTKKLESSLLKSNISYNKTSNVILADLEGKPLKTVGQNLVKSDANGSSTKTGDSSSSKISEISAKLPDDSDKHKNLHHKAALISKNEFVTCLVPEIDTGTEFSDKLVKPLVKEKDKVLCGKDEKNVKDIEKDKYKEKVIEKEKEKDKSLIKEKQKDREIPENVDKERKKDREVEFERKKDRESMEVIEREKKKENDLESDKKKDQSDVLDRRKESSDKKLQDLEKLKKKEEQKEKRKDTSDKKKDWLFSEKHKKSSSEEKKKENEYETKKKDKGERPSSIGNKRRISSQDGMENIVEEIKKAKTDHKRRDSKDNKSVVNTSTTNFTSTNKVTKLEQKCQETKFIDSKCKTSDLLVSQKATVLDKNQDLKKKDDSEKKKTLEVVEKKKEKVDVKKIQIKLEDVLKNVNDYNGKNKESGKVLSEAEDKKHCQIRKESKDKEKKKIFENNESVEDKKIQKKEKRVSTEKKKDEGPDGKQLKEKGRNDNKKENGHETETDSDSEPKKHSIFDVVLDEPAYISMYDKVKARSCKNMQKQEEVKKQGKLKEKFSQLKQSRAKREEKKRSTSWDEDSDSDTSQIRRIPRRSFSRLSSEDESSNKREKKGSEYWDSENKRLKKCYDTSEDEGIKFRPAVHKIDIYSEDSDVELAENDEKLPKKVSSKFKSKNIFETLDEDNLKKSVEVAKENFQATPKPEKIVPESKNKVRLSLDSSTDRFCVENKKLNLAESISEGEPSYLSSAKGIEKVERKKSKKRNKRLQSVDNDSKLLEEESVFTIKTETFLTSNKPNKQERKKSAHSVNENHDDNSTNKKKHRCLRETFECNAISKLEDNNGEQVFHDFLEDSNDHLSETKIDATVSKGSASKWHVSQVYGTDSDSNVDSVELLSVEKLRKSREKRKREKKIREPSEELLKAGKALEKILTSPSCRRNSEERKCNDTLEESGDEKLKVSKEKKKKRKKSKDEKSGRHHHHHHHHHHDHGFTEKTESSLSSVNCRAAVKSPIKAAHSSPSLPSLLELNDPSLDIKQEPISPTPQRVQNSKSSEKIVPGFGYEIDENIHETAVQSIALLEIGKSKPRSDVKEAVEVPEQKKEESKERTIISQEETEDAVAALLGETFSYSCCFERNSPLETDPEPHDEEEMRQAVQSLKEGKPDTPQSESGLQIDTDVEESDEHFGGMRFESLPRTPDLDLSQPPKTPDIQQSYLVETKQPITFPRKDTIRNSREEMEVPIVDPTSPDPLVPFKNVEVEVKDKDVDLMPPILKPASPKLFKDEPPIIEPISSLNSSERIYVDNRLLLHPPPLVPVAKSITVTKSSPALSLVRPKTSLSSNNTPPTLVLTSIRTTTALSGSHPNSQISKKPYIVSTTSNNISTSRSSVPPILSPVTASLSTPVLLTSTCNESSNLSGSSRLTSSTTIVSSQQIPSHLISQKIFLHQVPRTTTRPTPPQSAVVKVVDTLNVQKSSSNEMPTLTLSESVNTNSASVKTFPPSSLGPVVCQTLASTSSIASSNVTQLESNKTASVISILPRSLPITIPSQEYSRFTSITCEVNASKVTNIPTSLDPCSGNTSVISVHSNALNSKNSILENQQLINQDVLSTPKVSSFPALQKNMEYEKLSVPESTTFDSVKVKLPNSPVQSYTIENDNLNLQNSVTENLVKKEKLNEENTENCKQEIIEHSGDLLEDKIRDTDKYEGQLNVNDYNALKKNSAGFVAFNESVIKKINSKPDIKTEENELIENTETCEKPIISPLIIQDESSRMTSSEEENKQVIAATSKKGRKKINRGGISSKKGKNSCENKSDISPRKKGVKVQSKSSNSSGKNQSKDIYEFHDESDEDGSGEKDRPRLILTIKSPNSVKDQPVPAPAPAPAPAPKSCPPVCKSPNSLSRSPKESGRSVKSPELKSPSIEKDFGVINTRKSKRLLEKDGYRNTVDDVIEDVVKNGANKKATSPRRSLRQITKTSSVLPTKKVAAKTSKKLTESSFVEDDTKKEGNNVAIEESDSTILEKNSALPISKTHQQIKEKQEPEAENNDEESMTLIDPVTGMLMVMRAKEEGKYVPVANVPPIAPPTPPLPPAKTETLPMVTEGLASHWLTQESIKQAVIKVQTYEGNKVNPLIMNRPPTPPTTPQNRVQESTTRLPLDIKKKVIAEQFFESESSKSATDMNKVILQPLTKQKICHLDSGKIYPDVSRGEYVETKRNSVSEAGKIIRQISKIQPVPSVNKNFCSKGVAILTSPNKLYQNPKYVKMPPQNQILTGAVASSPPRVVKTTPPAHELHPMTGAVASPPPRAPHLTSQQPVVTGASSSRALVDPLKGPGASPRGIAIPPYEATMGEGINMGHLGHSPFVHPQLMYQQYLRAQEILPSPYQLTASLQGKLEERERERGAGDMGRSPPLELRSQRATDSPTVYMSRQQYTRYYDEPPPAHLHAGRHIHQTSDAPGQPRLQIATPPHASQVPPQADSLLILLQRYPIMWQGLLALKNDQSAVQMHFVFGNPHVARDSLPCNSDGSTPPLRIAQRMRLEQTQLEGVARKMQMDNEHCMLLALPCGRDHMDVLQQSTNLQTGFITYLQQKQAAGIVNIAHPGSQQAAYVVHIFPSCEFANENLARNAPDLLHRMQEIPHLVIVIATV